MSNPIQKLIGRVRRTKDGRTLASNFGYLMLLQIASYVFPLLTIPYLARVIGVDGFGKIAFAAAVIVWLQTVADWGFNFTATRDVARNRDNPDKIAEIFSNVLWARLLLMLLSFLLLLAAISVIPYFKENKTLLLITFLLVPGKIFFPEWFFQAMERMKYITYFDFISKALFTALIFVFINEQEDYILQPLLLALGYVLSGLAAMYIILIKWKIKLITPRWSAVSSTIKSSTDVFINNIMPNFYVSFSTVLLGFFGGSAANGLLDAGSKFVGICQQFMAIISRVFFPFLSRKLDKHTIYAVINLSLAVIFSGALFISAPWVVKIFFTEEFYQAIPVLKILSLSIIFLSLNNIYGINYMIIKGYEKKLKRITVFCSLIGFIISFPLIYFYSYIGAAVTIGLTRCILGSVVSFQAIKIKNKDY